MALVNITNVNVLGNPSLFQSPFQFEIIFECLQELADDLEWKIIYVGNAEDSQFDQILEEVSVGPVPMGMNRFVLEGAAPNPGLIENSDLLGVTVILISCSYLNQQFVQIGYYVNNDYMLEFDPENVPNPLDISKIQKNILHDQPRVTRFAIDWTGNQVVPAQPVFVIQDQAIALEEEADEDDLIIEGNDQLEDEIIEVEDDDENEEVDLDALEEADNAEMDNDDAEEENEVEPINELGTSNSNQIMVQEIHNGDSNSMDIERMMQ